MSDKVVRAADGESLETVSAGKVTCWFCQRREADPTKPRVVKLVKSTILEHKIGSIKSKEEEVKIPIPRCSQCASVRKKTNMVAITLTITALLFGLGSCVLLMQNGYGGMAIFSGIALPIIMIALFMFWIAKRDKNLTLEQRQDNENANKPVEEYPTISQLLKQGWGILGEGDAAELEM